SPEPWPSLNSLGLIAMSTRKEVPPSSNESFADRWSRVRRILVPLAGTMITLIISLVFLFQGQDRAMRSAREAALIAEERASRSMELEQRIRDLVKKNEEISQIAAAVKNITQVPPEAKVSADLGEL